MFFAIKSFMKKIIEKYYKIVIDEANTFEIKNEYNKNIVMILYERNYYVFKMFKMDCLEITYIKAINSYLNYLYYEGIPICKYVSTVNNKYVEFEKGYFFSLERRASGNIQVEANEKQAYDMGKVLSQMHIVARKYKLKDSLQYPTSIFSKNDVNKYNFLSFLKIIRNDIGETSILKQIESLFFYNRSKLIEIWNDLPNGVCQADFLLKNIAFENNNISEVFDFNLCSNKIFVYDFAQSVLFNFKDFSDNERKNFYSFIYGYIYNYKLIEVEIEAWLYLCRILYPTWKSKLNNILMLSNNQKIIEVEKILSVLNGDMDEKFTSYRKYEKE